jgi:hypothetical protein
METLLHFMVHRDISDWKAQDFGAKLNHRTNDLNSPEFDREGHDASCQVRFIMDNHDNFEGERDARIING